jgi:flagellar biosynthetic protein FliQ
LTGVPAFSARFFSARSIAINTKSTIMNETEVIEVVREGILVSLKIGGPFMLLSLVIGLVISLFQALTQIQEQTLTFVPKLVIIFGAMILLAPFMLASLSEYTLQLADRIIGLGMN